MATSSRTALLRRRQVQEETGYPRSTIYLLMEKGLWPRPIRIGARSVAWAATEVRALNAARTAGWSDQKIRNLVERLEQDRRTAMERLS